LNQSSLVNILMPGVDAIKLCSTLGVVSKLYPQILG
jgi:hypothetical protein